MVLRSGRAGRWLWMVCLGVGGAGGVAGWVCGLGPWGWCGGGLVWGKEGISDRGWKEGVRGLMAMLMLMERKKMGETYSASGLRTKARSSISLWGTWRRSWLMISSS